MFLPVLLGIVVGNWVSVQQKLLTRIILKMKLWIKFSTWNIVKLSNTSFIVSILLWRRLKDGDTIPAFEEILLVTSWGKEVYREMEKKQSWVNVRKELQAEYLGI